MGARQKLNAITIQGCLIVSGIMGLVSQSWLVFLIAAVVSIGGSLAGGDIRPGQNSLPGSRSMRPGPRRRLDRRRPPSGRR